MDMERTGSGPEPTPVTDQRTVAEPGDIPTALNAWAMTSQLGRLGAEEDEDEPHILRGLE